MKRCSLLWGLLLWVWCATAIEKSPIIVYIDGTKYHIHTVQIGETLYALAKTYQVGEEVIIANNPSMQEGLKAGIKLKIPVTGAVREEPSEKRLRRTFDFHYVEAGETLYSISRRYEVPIQALIADNSSIDPIHLRLRERVLIRKKLLGSEDENGSKQGWEAYRQQLNSVTDGAQYYIVQPGETLYGLARRFNTSEHELSVLNHGLTAANLKAGAMIKVKAIAPSVTEQPLPTTAKPTPIDSLASPASTPQILFQALQRNDPLDVALMLPLSVDSVSNPNYRDFYQGFLLGLDSVKHRYGISVNLRLYNTERDIHTVRNIVNNSDFNNTQLIVGPVYEEVMAPVLRMAETQHIPVVSPLANMTTSKSNCLFQMAADPRFKYQKIANLIDSNKNITLIYTDQIDRDFEREILGLLTNTEYTRHTFRYIHPSVLEKAKEREEPMEDTGDLTPLLESNHDKDNLFIVMAGNEVDVDRILAALASANTNITSRGLTPPRFAVLGNARWNRYNNIDRSIFFKTRVIFLSSYHAKRDAEIIRQFDSSYIQAFSQLPTLFSYRGYDAAMIFVPAMYNDIEYNMEGRRYKPLQTEYLFGLDEQKSIRTNQTWMRVNYLPNFTITLE